MINISTSFYLPKQRWIYFHLREMVWVQFKQIQWDVSKWELFQCWNNSNVCHAPIREISPLSNVPTFFFDIFFIATLASQLKERKIYETNIFSQGQQKPYRLVSVTFTSLPWRFLLLWPLETARHYRSWLYSPDPSWHQIELTRSSAWSEIL